MSCPDTPVDALCAAPRTQQPVVAVIAVPAVEHAMKSPTDTPAVLEATSFVLPRNRTWAT